MPELVPVFDALKALLLPYAGALDVKVDSDTQVYLDTRHRQPNGKALFFGAVQLRKRYVSFHLMPVYVEPALLGSVSEALRRRMHGKSCFNFTAVDECPLGELAALTKAGYEFYRQRGYL